MNEKIRTVGDIYYEFSLVDGPGIRIIKEFMMKLVRAFSKQASSYIRVTGEVPFVFKERQLHSILAPALASFTDAFLMESPVNRNWSAMSIEERVDSHGWVDYWCYYRGISFLMELKHGFISSRTGNVTKTVREDWKQAIEQLNVIEKEAKVQSECTNGAFRVALDVLPLYETVNSGRFKTENEKIISIHRNSLLEFEPLPNWSALWLLHKDLIGPYEYLNSTEYYPGVLFLSRISEICRS